MDLDAILARRPALVLVDELAHTNAPGSRHPKRYLDVEELLAAGIDVYSTLNIQHVESLNDVVARITRIRVRETVPDSVIDRADDIELIDLTPQDLIQRLQEGKVYVPAQAERAVRHYFAARQPDRAARTGPAAHRPARGQPDGRLHAQPRDRRALAGRRTRAGLRPGRPSARRPRCAMPSGWPISSVRPGPRSIVETAGSHRASDEIRTASWRRCGWPSQLGGEPVLIPGQDVADAVIDYARANNVTHVIVGKSVRPRVAAGPVRVGHATADQPSRRHQYPCDRSAGRSAAERSLPTSRAPAKLAPKPYAISVAARSGWRFRSARVLHDVLGVANVALVFLTAILVGAVLYGLGPSLFACLVAVLAYNFFFLPPLYTFTIADPENVVALFFFAVVAVIASNLAARVRGQAVAARQRARQPPTICISSAASWRSRSRWTTCSGRPRTRSR